MNEFVLIFRNDMSRNDKPSPEQMQEILSKWQQWMSDIAAQGKLANSGNRLGDEGKTLRPKQLVTDGPYAEIKEMISGYIIVNAASIDEAASIAEGCPILEVGGNVEIRNVIPMAM